MVAPDGIPALKLHSSDSSTILNTVTGYGDGYIEINKVRYEHSVLVCPKARWCRGTLRALKT